MPMNAMTGFRARLRNGESLIGCIIQSYSPQLVGICGPVGFDFLFLDAELLFSTIFGDVAPLVP